MQRGFCLPAAHGGLNNDQAGGCSGFQDRCLNGVWGEGKRLLEGRLAQGSTGPANPGEGGGCQAPALSGFDSCGRGKELLIGPDPIGHCDETGQKPKVGERCAKPLFIRGLGWELAKEGDQPGQDFPACVFGLRSQGLGLPVQVGASALGAPVVCPHGHGPDLGTSRLQQGLDMDLADESVVRDGVSGGQAIFRGYWGGVEPGRAFGLKAEGDFSNVVQGGKCGTARREDGPHPGREGVNQRLRNGTHICAVVLDGDAWKAFPCCFRPAMTPESFHWMLAKEYDRPESCRAGSQNICSCGLANHIKTFELASE
jgi:hypothetical protein